MKLIIFINCENELQQLKLIIYCYEKKTLNFLNKKFNEDFTL